MTRYNGGVVRRLSLVVASLVAGCATASGGGDPADPDGSIIIPNEHDGAPDRPDAWQWSPPDAAPPRPDAMPPPCTPAWTNLLTNASLDLGATGWTESSGGGYPIITPAAQLPILPQSGNYAAWTGGYDGAYDQLFQMVTIPPSATGLRMSGWGCFASAETPGSGVWDAAGVGILDASASLLETLVVFTNEHAPSASSCGWIPFSVNAASAYPGQTVIFYVEASNDSINATSFFFDTFVFEALVCE